MGPRADIHSKHVRYDPAVRRARRDVRRDGRTRYVDFSPRLARWVVWSLGGPDDPTVLGLFWDRYFQTMIEA